MAAEFGKVAVIGEREIALGFKLLGIKDVFIYDGKDASAKLASIMESKDYDLVIASYSIKDKLTPGIRRLTETALKPLVVFIPSEKEAGNDTESVDALAKRILGIDIYKK